VIAEGEEPVGRLRDDRPPFLDCKGQLVQIAESAALQLIDVSGIEAALPEVSPQTMAGHPYRSAGESPPSAAQLRAHIVFGVGGNVALDLFLVVVVVRERVMNLCERSWRNLATSSSGVMPCRNT